MLQKLRDQTQGTGFKVLVVALILVLTLFGFGATAVFSGGDPEIAQVGDFEITQSYLATETERERIRVLSRMGADFDPSSIDRLELQQYVLQQVIGRQVLTEANQLLGISVSDRQVNDELVTSPAYQVDGQFNEAVYRQSVNSMGYRPVEFLQVVGEDLSRTQLRNALVDSASLSQWDLTELIRVVNQQRDIAYFPLTIDSYNKPKGVSAEEIETRYNENLNAYMTELAVDAAYIALSVDTVLQMGGIDVTEEELLSLYEDDRAAALRDEERAASHILIQVNDSRDEIAARALILEIQTRLNAGEEFASLAQELSEDAGSKTNGGDLGSFNKGTFPADFEDALWALGAPGDVSEAVLTEAGFHLIQLNGIVEQDYPSFESMTQALTERVQRLKAEESYSEMALELERIAYEERYSLDGVASELGLSVVKVPQVSASDQKGDEILANSAVLAALFGADVLDGSNSEAIQVGAGQVVFVRADQQYEPEPKTLEQVSEQIRQEISLEIALTEIATAKEVGLAQLEAGESVSAIADTLGGSWRTHTLATRAGLPEVPQDILNRAFELPRPPEGEKSVGAIDLTDGSAALITVTRVVPGNISFTPDETVNQLRQALQSRVARVEFESFFVAAENTVGVDRPISSEVIE
ncbi:MAG: SurA N-terminal domain-containing protein [Pseudomonadota bacterium]